MKGKGKGMRIEGLSVVTPTFGNAELVDTMLQSCAEAGRCAEVDWEHIIVDSTPDSAQTAAIRRSCQRYGATYLRKIAGVGPKRNVGVRAAKHPLVLFIDSDCMADPNLFTEHLRLHERDQVGAVAGPTEMVGPDAAFVWRVVRRAKQYNHCYAWPYRYDDMGWSTTSNLSVRADVLAEIGGFDDDPLTIQGGDDVDLGVRISKAGHRITTNTGAVVYHARSPMSRVSQVADRVFTYGTADGWLCTKHPDLTVPYLNPFVIVLAAALVGHAKRSTFPHLGRAAGPAMLALLLLREAASRHEKGAGLRGAVEDLVCSAVDMCFDAGEIYAAARLRKPGNVVRRFRYVQPQWFVATRRERGAKP